MKNAIACCGLDCEKCDAYLATVQNDDALREKTAQLWSQLNGVPITKDMINCTGCREDGVKTPFCQSMCQIRICVNEKGHSTCAQCEKTADCQMLAAITANNAQALENLHALRDAHED